MPLILGWFRMVGTGRLNGSGLILILATVWTCLAWVTLVSVSTLFATLGVLGACVATWRLSLSDGMFSWTAFMMPLAISVVLIGMLLVSLSPPVRKLGLWLVLLPLVVGCLIVLLPCAFGMVALSLARLNISLGIVLVACVMSLTC